MEHCRPSDDRCRGLVPAGIFREYDGGSGAEPQTASSATGWCLADASEAQERQDGVVRAYDAHGKLIGTVDQSRYYLTCHRAPGGALIPWGTTADPSTCRDAVPWR
jgi:hypothetical protein